MRRWGLSAFWVTAFGAVGLFSVFGSGCTLKHLAVNQTAEILVDANRAFASEPDRELAAAAIPASLKTIEGFLAAHPQQPQLLELLAEGYFNYAFAFLETDAERQQLVQEDAGAAAKLRVRALGLYKRSSVFALRLLEQRRPELAAMLRHSQIGGHALLAPDLLSEVGKDDVAPLFWFGSAQAAIINLSKDDPSSLARLPIAKAILARTIELDEDFFFASAMTSLGAIAASTPQALGGDPKLASRHFERAIELTGGRHLFSKVLYARMVGVQKGDKNFYANGLRDVLAADPNVDPQMALANHIAQARAKVYLEIIDDVFLD